MKRLTLLSVFIALAMLLSACSVHLGLSKVLGGGGSTTSATKSVKATHTPPAPGSAAAAPAANAVNINNAKYRPKNMSVKVGTTVTWKNDDSVPQSVTSDAPGLFDSGPLQPGATFQYTFAQAGTFPYHSTATSTTFGSVTVTP
jgi:plastocyanin